MRRRCGNGIVFSWGIANDGRIGSDLTKEQMDIITSEEERELLSVKPSIVRFPIPGTIIVKVACGNSYTIALEETQGLVYSWG